MKASSTTILVMMALYSFGQAVTMGQSSTKNYDLHMVMKGETLYSVSRTFHTSVNELLKLNPEIVNNNLQEGKTIRVPLSNSSLTSVPENETANRKTEKAILHSVEKGETVFSISKKFNTDVTTILMWNDLSEPSIKVGQNLIVGYEKFSVAAPLPMKNEKQEVASGAENGIVSDKNEAQEKTNDAAARNASMIYYSEKGIATWTKSDYDEGNFYALHVSAPIGTEITVRNLMNNKSIKVKVIGKLPATSENENVLIKLSQSAARQLNALDEKFLVEINYIAPEMISTSGTN